MRNDQFAIIIAFMLICSAVIAAYAGGFATAEFPLWVMLAGASALLVRGVTVKP